MVISRPTACVVYAVTALVALVGTWGNNLQLASAGLVEANITFWRETLATPVSRSITVDLFLLGFPVTLWMLFEARRLELPLVWLSILFGALIAISVTVPLFMLHRERTLMRREAGTPAGVLRSADVVGLVVLGVVALSYTALALR